MPEMTEWMQQSVREVCRTCIWKVPAKLLHWHW